MKRLLILTLPALLLASTVNTAFGDAEAAKRALGEISRPGKSKPERKKLFL